ncbi:MAG: RDD family protein [Xanthomonadales bacterium]|nr:RDD family protein [Xanthomonadales bacterium]NIX12200.1 RDD family protein [Xanthomonadales bacterium]
MSESGSDMPARSCGLGRRMMAIAYDALVVLGLLLMAGVIALPFDAPGRQAFRDPWFTLYLAAVWFLYLAWCWRRGGMTLGMRAWRIRLTTVNGNPPGWAACLARFTVGVAGTAALGAGLAWSLIDRHKRCWHDLASGTRLVRVTPESDRLAENQDGAEPEQQ